MTETKYNSQDADYLFTMLAEKLRTVLGLVPIGDDQIEDSRKLYARLELLSYMIDDIANEAEANAERCR